MIRDISKRTLANALAYMAITDSKKYLHISTKVACGYYSRCNTESGGRFYILTAEGQAIAETSKLWKGHQHLLSLGFKLADRTHKPAHVMYRHPEQVETPAGRMIWRDAFTGKRGCVFADVQLFAGIPGSEQFTGWGIRLIAEF